jgi:hypothetical protein
MSVTRPNPEAKPSIGEMPTPRYIVEAPSTVTDERIKWVGMDAYGLDGQLKPFLWYRNYSLGDLTDKTDRYNAAALVARIKLEMDAEAAIGPAIDLHRSDSETGFVKQIDEPAYYGLYIEAPKRPIFNFRVAMNGIKDEAALRAESPVEFDEVFQQAKAVLPMPKVRVAHTQSE